MTFFCGGVDLFLEHFYKCAYWVCLSDVKSSASLREKLAEAINGKDVKALQEAIEECENARYPELSCDLQEARGTLENLGGGRGG